MPGWLSRAGKKTLKKTLIQKNMFQQKCSLWLACLGFPILSKDAPGACSMLQPPLSGVTWRTLTVENRTLIPALTSLQQPLQTHSFLSLVTFTKVSNISYLQFALATPAVSECPSTPRFSFSHLAFH